MIPLDQAAQAATQAASHFGMTGSFFLDGGMIAVLVVVIEKIATAYIRRRWPGKPTSTQLFAMPDPDLKKKIDDHETRIQEAEKSFERLDERVKNACLNIGDLKTDFHETKKQIFTKLDSIIGEIGNRIEAIRNRGEK